MLRFAPAGRRLNILCLGAHPDDIEIGCGGTLLVLSQRDDVEVRRLVLTGTAERIKEARSAAAVFSGGPVEFGTFADGRLPAEWSSVKQFLEDRARMIVQPDLIFAPRPQDAHQDHALLGSLASTVWRDSTVLHYEIPKWDGDLAPMTHFVPVPADAAELKYELLTKCYPSQTTRDWWDREMFLGLLRLRGMECRSHYAEGFTSSKTMIDFGVDKISSRVPSKP